MLAATFGATTGWIGKTITYENEQFMLEGHGPITPADVMNYDRQGYLVWVNDGARAWVGARVEASHRSQVAAPSTATAPSRTNEAPGATPGASGRYSPRAGAYLKRVLLLAIALLVVANVVLLLILARAF
jgi:hypothetical protein